MSIDLETLKTKAEQPCSAVAPNPRARVPLPVRHQQILRLLDTRYDGLPEPTRRDHAAAGFVHATVARESCPDCLANDRAMFGCESCGGRGWVESARSRDPYAVRSVAPFGLDGTHLERDRAVVRQIERLAAQTRPPWASELDLIADANLHPAGWEIARARMFDRFDYAALERALELLAMTHPGLSARSSLGLAFVDARMPSPIRAPREQVVVPAKGRALNGHSLKQRDALIRRLVLSEDRPVQWVAREYGLSPSQVNRICARQVAA